MKISPSIKKFTFYLSLIVNILIVAALVIAGYGGKVDPETTALPAIFAMTFPIWLILTALILITDLFSFRKLAFIPVIGLLSCLGPIYAYSPLNFPKKLSEEQKEKSFTLMSYNVYAFVNTLDTVARKNLHTPEEHRYYRQLIDSGAYNLTVSWLIHTPADILCTQETPYMRQTPQLLMPWAQIDSLRQTYPHHTTYFGADIFSNFGLIPVKLRQNDSSSCRICGAYANIHGHKTLIISAHFQSIGLSDEDKALYHQLTEGEGGRQDLKEAKNQLLSKLSDAFRERAKQTRLLREQIDSIGCENVIVAGDFNDIPDCYALRELQKDDFKSAFSMAGCGPTITYHVNRFYFHIDHIIYRGKMRAVAFRRYDVPYSDHYPIEATFVWDD